jgi:SET domain
MERWEDGPRPRTWCADLLILPIALFRVSNSLPTGSLFNHSDSPNVSYSIDTITESIRYATARAVEPDEELCIYYGSNLWFKSVEISNSNEHTCTDTELVEDDWGGLSAVAAGEASPPPPPKRVLEDIPNPNEILPDEDLPFTRVKLTSDEDDEETSETVRTGEHVPHFPARLLMPNTSTGMGRGHPGPTTHNLSTEVYISLP